MDRQSSLYLHIIHSHAAGEFGFGEESTSHIELLWSSIKYLIKKLYNMIPSKIFYTFLKEREFRYNI